MSDTTEILVLRDGTSSASRTKIGVVTDPDSSDPDDIVQTAIEQSDFTDVLPGSYELYLINGQSETTFNADHLEAPSYE